MRRSPGRSASSRPSGAAGRNPAGSDVKLSRSRDGPRACPSPRGSRRRGQNRAPQQGFRLPDAVGVRLRRMRMVDVDPGEDVVDSLTPCTSFPPRERAAVAGLPGPKRPVVAVRRAREALADERPGDDTADGAVAGSPWRSRRPRRARRAGSTPRARRSGRRSWPTYTIHLPVRWCSSPSPSMISVPDAALLPSTPRPVRWANSSITSKGKPCG